MGRTEVIEIIRLLQRINMDRDTADKIVTLLEKILEKLNELEKDGIEVYQGKDTAFEVFSNDN